MPSITQSILEQTLEIDLQENSEIMFLISLQKLDHTTHNGGKTMNSFREKALWENNQRLLCQKDILQRQLKEVKQTRNNIAELEAMSKSLQEVQ